MVYGEKVVEQARMTRSRALSLGGLGRNVVGLSNLDSTGEAPLLECGESEGRMQEEGSSRVCTCTRFS